MLQDWELQDGESMQSMQDEVFFHSSEAISISELDVVALDLGSAISMRHQLPMQSSLIIIGLSASVHRTKRQIDTPKPICIRSRQRKKLQNQFSRFGRAI
jgi:hypothetical protein